MTLISYSNQSIGLDNIFTPWFVRKKSANPMELEDETFEPNITFFLNLSKPYAGNKDVNQHRYRTCEQGLEYLRYIWIIYFPFLFVFGLVGNILTLIVLSKEKHQSSKNVYLSALTLADIIFLILGLPLYLDQLRILDKNETFAQFITSYRAVGLMVINTCIAASRGIIICFSVERFIAIRHPLHAKHFCKKVTAIKITTAVFIISLSYTAYPVVQFIWAMENDSLVYIARYKYPPWLQRYEEFTHWIWIIMLCMTFFILVVINGILIRELRKRRHTLKKLTGFEGHKMFHENAITVILIATATVFLVTQFPVLFNTILAIVGMWRSRQVFPERCRHSMVIISDLFVLTNASLNCLLYIGVSRTFGKTLKGLCCRKPNSIPSISEGNMSSLELFYLNTMELYPSQRAMNGTKQDVNKNLNTTSDKIETKKLKLNKQYLETIQESNLSIEHETLKLLDANKSDENGYILNLQNHTPNIDCELSTQENKLTSTLPK